MRYRILYHSRPRYIGNQIRIPFVQLYLQLPPRPSNPNSQDQEKQVTWNDINSVVPIYLCRQPTLSIIQHCIMTDLYDIIPVITNNTSSMIYNIYPP